MNKLSRRTLCKSGLLGGLAFGGLPMRDMLHAKSTKYICPPCGCAMDGRDFDGAGTCPACGMNLIPKPDFRDGKRPHDLMLIKGSGHFIIPGGCGRRRDRIGVWYHRPVNFNKNSPVLIVLPGAGRNGHSYRDAWVKASEHYGFLIAALAYPPQTYDYSAYNMGGLIKNFEIQNLQRNSDGSLKAHYFVEDEDISFELNIRPEQWLFNDLDRVFKILKNASGSNRTNYDLFGHSAGAQILHRAALLQGGLKADRIIAANSGTYTLPMLDAPLITGLKDTGATTDTLERAFARKLVILVGERDDRNETRGTLLHTPTLDQQGLGRVERGQYFYAQSSMQAEKLGLRFSWQIKIVSDVGHDFRAMSKAAVRVLYGPKPDRFRSKF